MGDSKLGWLGLAWFEGFGAVTLKRLAEAFDHDGERAWNAQANELHKLEIRPKVVAQFIEWRATVTRERLFEICEQSAIRFVLSSDEEYPESLRETPDHPFALFLRGAPLAFQHPVTIVGTRRPTEYGLRVTRSFVTDLVSVGCTIISGLALGIDGAAHLATLDQNGKTIGVLAGGLNSQSLYPRNNLPLAERMMREGGTLVSEFPPGTSSLKQYFPLRNRILAGLSQATVVIEATPKSGSLITAALALAANREVLAVPGPITNELSHGPNSLLKVGAIPCTSATDILDVLRIVTPKTKHKKQPAPKIPLSPEQQRIVDALTSPMHADDLGRTLHITPSQLSATLSVLELQGIIEDCGGRMYARIF